MAYEARPGQFSLFKNEKKEKDSHPDYKGDGMAPDGTPVWVSAWLKVGKNGKFMSCSMQAKVENGQRQGGKLSEREPGQDDSDPDVPF